MNRVREEGRGVEGPTVEGLGWRKERCRSLVDSLTCHAHRGIDWFSSLLLVHRVGGIFCSR